MSDTPLDDTIYADAKESIGFGEKVNDEDKQVGNIVALVEQSFKRAEDGRDGDERRWLRAYQNYRGIYSPDVQFTETEKSRIFVKITKTKVLAAYGQIVDVLFGNNRFPVSINPTKLPDGVADSVFFESDEKLREAQEAYKPTEEDRMPLPGETRADIKRRLGALSKKLAPVGDLVQEGTGNSPTSIVFHPAMIAAKKMEAKIHDQLEESSASKQLRSTAFEMALFGTGVMKGPFAEEKEYPSWDEDGTYNPMFKTIPKCEYVSIWNFYPDPDAANMEEADYCIQRHKMSRSSLRNLQRRPFFRSKSIKKAIELGPSYKREWWEQAMEDDSQETPTERWEVLEYWGYIDTDTLRENEVDIPKEMKNLDQLSVNVWVCNGEVLRLFLNPFNPTYLPFYAVPFEVNPYSFFGVGIGENMDDTQSLMNGFMRMSVDNGVLSGSLIFEIDEANLVPGQDLSISPGKVFRRAGGAPGQSIFGTKFPNVSQENMMMFDKARQLADESTGFPSFAHGQTGIQGVGRTASGMSMLMGAANGSIRTVVKNLDDYLLGPIGKGFFHFNMQFDYDPEIKGDLEVRAMGTESLMANEVRSQRLMQLLGVVQNPALAPFAKMDYIIREIAKSMDLDPDKVVNSLSDAAIQAELLKKFTKDNPPPEAPPQGQAPGTPGQAMPPAGVQVQDPTGSGGGTIGTGMVPQPGEQGFSANTGEMQ